MGWIEQARIEVRRATADLPSDATLAQRRKRLRAVGPAFHGGTYWGRKKWGQAVREYLEKHGLPRKPAPAPSYPADIIFPFRSA